ncbi:hypothetical protein QK887_25755, partial [Salmonella enterica subsp. enterica serovar Oslo]|nr:hypothetical protein [Salmonella enterica subsp. enterica serovar Oslo]
ILGLVGLLLAVVGGYAMLKAEMKFRRELVDYIGDLSFRIQRVEGEAVSVLPFGIVLYSEDKTVEWHNRFVVNMFPQQPLVGASLQELFPELVTA